MKTEDFYKIESEIKSVVQYAPVDISFLREKIASRTGFSEDDVEDAINTMVEEGKMFKPDSKSVQRV